MIPTDLQNDLRTLAELHERFENDANDLANFISYVNRIISVKRKAGQQSIEPSRLTNLFICIDKLKKSPHVESDLFDISCSNPVLMPAISYHKLPAHYTNSSPIAMPSKFNQAVYYNSSSDCSSASSSSLENSGYGNSAVSSLASSMSSSTSSLSSLLKSNPNSTAATNHNSASGSSTTIPIPIITSQNSSGTKIEIDGMNRFLTGTDEGFDDRKPIITNISSFPISSSPPLNDSFIMNFKKQQEEQQQRERERFCLNNTDINEFLNQRKPLDSLTLDDLVSSPPLNPSNTSTNSTIARDPPKRNWSLDFWNALQMSHNCGDENLKRSQVIQNIADEFVKVAKKHGKTIIREKNSLNKTIPPCDAGGFAGGLKFKKDGIFFKFAVDVYGMYGGDAFAMKAAGHELKGLMAYFNCQIDGLYLPLMALIDYMGYRLIATSELAIDNDKTLVYGSNDGGATIHDKSPDMKSKMKQAAEILNLKGHFTGRGEGTGKSYIYGPCDVEGHLTLDNHFVIIDTARIFPPEKPNDKIGSHLYNLLRPELVRSSKVALCSDAFTKFDVGSDKEANNEEVERSQKRLFRQIIPNFVLSLNQRVKRSKCQNIMELSHMILLIDSMHREGINVRYLNQLKKTDIHALDHRLTTILNTEIISRKIKNRLREFLRSSSTLPELKEICTFLNRLIIISLLQSCDLDGFSLELLLHRLSQMTGLTFVDDLAKLILNENHLIQPTDISLIRPKVKFLHMVPYQQGVALFHQAITFGKQQIESATTSNNPGSILQNAQQHSDQLFQQAAEKFKLAIQSKPDDYEILTHWGILLSMRAKQFAASKEYIQLNGTQYIERLFEVAVEKFEQAWKIKRNHHYTLYNWADCLKHWSMIKPPNSIEAANLIQLAKQKLKEAGVFEKKWFFGTLETNGAASLLTNKEAGSFIIRNSNSRPGSFVFSYLSDPNRKILHSIIKTSSKGGYHVENLPSRRPILDQQNQSNQQTNSAGGGEIKLNTSGTSVPTRKSNTALSSQAPVSNTVAYKTLEDFVSDKIKQGYIPITQNWQ